MEDLAIGRLLREVRVRLGWPQRVVAAKAGISTGAYSMIERGQFDSVPLGKLRRVAAALEVRLPLEPRWRGAAVDRLLSSRHALMTERVVMILIDAGWDARPEVSFNWYGERGVVDILAWHASTATVLLVELKTELVDVNGLLTVIDRRRRLASMIAEPFAATPCRGMGRGRREPDEPTTPRRHTNRHPGRAARRGPCDEDVARPAERSDRSPFLPARFQCHER